MIGYDTADTAYVNLCPLKGARFACTAVRRFTQLYPWQCPLSSNFDTVRRYFEYRVWGQLYFKIIHRAKEKKITPQGWLTSISLPFIEDVKRLWVSVCDPSSACCGVYGWHHPFVGFDWQGLCLWVRRRVYFPRRKSHNYAKLANKTLWTWVGRFWSDRWGETARKRKSVDFALWKATKPGEISKDSPWGEQVVRAGTSSARHVDGDFRWYSDITVAGQTRISSPYQWNRQSEPRLVELFANYWMRTMALSTSTMLNV